MSFEVQMHILALNLETEAGVPTLLLPDSDSDRYVQQSPKRKTIILNSRQDFRESQSLL